ncbi:lipid II flippase Amj family protein [Escherichia coli]|uniref:lipid II flippase family protein n=1 Tax=Escherichia coli TaxID=562 RepID=UPI000543DF6B|nr:DUF2837 family protein [Escherichia coli]AUA39896.1 DUF2837 domain-containing protein [Escherichia coli]EES2727514.1 DUF2837 family protein [Escherichia coli]EEZ5233689.1 DUF2837 family protein [Escherichia coli]EFB3175908.1 DUF2837 family protein [Escherichia coli]EFC4389841.1 DUF2837 family protein [Escherichia coli]
MNVIIHNWYLYLIPFLYGMMLLIEFISQYSRVAGYFINRNAIAYSLQNTTFTLTRFFSVLLMPLIGLMVDNAYTPSVFIACVLLSFYFVAILGCGVFFFRKSICNFYIRFITNYVNGGGIFHSFFKSLSCNKNKKIKVDISDIDNFIIDFKYFFIACFIYSIHATGIFMTFYFALISPIHKIMITQMSGVINAFATLLLTFKIDPALSVAIERRHDFISAFVSIFYARIFVFFVIAPAIFLLLYKVTA